MVGGADQLRHDRIERRRGGRRHGVVGGPVDLGGLGSDPLDQAGDAWSSRFTIYSADQTLRPVSVASFKSALVATDSRPQTSAQDGTTMG
jgi:hypothetical protein